MRIHWPAFVAGKRGTKPGRGDECTTEQYALRNKGAIHTHPLRVRSMIREGAERAVRRADTEDFGLIDLHPPFRSTLVLRATADKPRMYSVVEHPDDICALMNAPHDLKPVESDEQLRELLVD